MDIRTRPPNPTLLLVILAGCAGEDAPTDTSSVTWGDDVKGLVEAQCAGCHFEGSSAPLAFETYAQVAAAAPAMRAAMVAGRMPPWPADPSCRSYVGQRVLSAEDLATFEAWVDQGLAEGPPTSPIAVSPEPFAADLTLRAVAPYTPQLGSSGDDYRCFLLDHAITEPTFVTGNTVEPATNAVHHVLVYSLSATQAAEAEQLDAAEAGEGYTCFGGPVPSSGAGMGMGADAVFPTQIAGWVPGTEPVRLEAGSAVPLEPGSRLVMQIHYSAAGGAPQPDHTALLLSVTEQPPARVVRTVPFAVRDLDIPAGRASVEVSRSFTNWSSNPATLTNLTGHMHLLGRSIRADLISSSGPPACGLSIPRWDFDWQINYEFDPSDPLVVAPGESVRLSCTYDNSAANQPVVDGMQQAPRDVSWGEGSLDEMCLLYAAVVEDYVPPSASGAGECAPAEACFEASDGSLSGILACETASPTCGLCAVGALQRCGLIRCLLPLASARACVTDCVLSLNAFGGSMDTCLRASCGAEYTAMLGCADPEVVAGSCDQALAGCGLTP